MPLIKELEDQLPLLPDMDEKYQKWAARNLRQLICSHETPPIEVRVFRHIPLAGERTENDEGIEIHGRADGVHHPAG